MEEKSSVYKDAAKVSGIIFLLGIIETVLFFVFDAPKIKYPVSAAYGCIFASLNFFYLAYCVKKSMTKDEKDARVYMSGTYSTRIFLTAVMIFFAAKLDFINIWAAIIPLSFVRIAIFVLTIVKKKRAASPDLHQN